MTQHERPEDIRHEEFDERGKPMVPATPRDVVHIRVGSFVLIFCFAIGVLGIIAHAPVITWIAGIAAVITVVDIVLAARRQKTRGAGEAG
ncbi:hypothetical protein ACIBH1_15790 [Nonomuraea sp. NPDC050663]|uniref:hypothetical protein n=1 Tax=Nonomuraea sp. NPDC050663 TaxID=3364370 RepID=UPI00178FC5B4|nr:hypothetical protein [Thermoactinospora sp.]